MNIVHEMMKDNSIYSSNMTKGKKVNVVPALKQDWKTYRGGKEEDVQLYPWEKSHSQTNLFVPLTVPSA